MRTLRFSFDGHGRTTPPRNLLLIIKFISLTLLPFDNLLYSKGSLHRGSCFFYGLTCLAVLDLYGKSRHSAFYETRAQHNYSNYEPGSHIAETGVKPFLISLNIINVYKRRIKYA